MRFGELDLLRFLERLLEVLNLDLAQFLVIILVEDFSEVDF